MIPVEVVSYELHTYTFKQQSTLKTALPPFSSSAKQRSKRICVECFSATHPNMSSPLYLLLYATPKQQGDTFNNNLQGRTRRHGVQAVLNNARCCLMASVSFVSIAWLLTSILSSQIRTKTWALKGSGKMLGLHSTCPWREGKIRHRGNHGAHTLTKNYAARRYTEV